MPRYKLIIEYDGTGLAGWQRQPDRPSVQQHIEEAIAAFCGEDTRLHCAGRTDAGVHARGQVAHGDLYGDVAPFTLMQAVNHHLRPRRIAVVQAEIVPETFHARFSATARHYRYRIINRRAPLTLDLDQAWHIHAPLDVAAMQEAAPILLGHHDFTSFRSTICQAKSPEKTLDHLDIIHDGNDIRLDISARSFLHNQVRILTGSLVKIGKGKWTKDDLRRALLARDRRAAGPTAPACGLCLMRVEYGTLPNQTSAGRSYLPRPGQRGEASAYSR